jgi:hypothetical protein
MDSGKQEPASLAALAAEVCKASMRGDQAALLQGIDANPELVNHPDDQVCKCLRGMAHVSVAPLFQCNIQLVHTGPLSASLGRAEQPHIRSRSIDRGMSLLKRF